jgi:hypothetical protein
MRTAPPFEVARVLVCFGHVASVIKYTDDGTIGLAIKFRVIERIVDCIRLGIPLQKRHGYSLAAKLGYSRKLLGATLTPNFFAGGPLNYRPIHLTIIRHV